MNSLHLVPFIVLGLSAILALHQPIGRDIWIPLFLLPWTALTPDVGVNLPVSKLLFALLAVKYALRGQFSIAAIPSLGIVTLLILVGIFSAIITLSTQQADLIVAGGELRNGGFRSIVVTINFLLSVLPFALLFARGVPHSVPTLLRVYIISVCVLCLIGITQYAIFVATGQDVLPIGLFSLQEDQLRTATLVVISETTLRPSSLAGEPKNLGIYATTAVALLMAFGRMTIPNALVRLSVTAVLVGTIFLTSSTSAFLSLGICVLIYFAMRAFRRHLRPQEIFLTYTIAAAAILGIFVYNVSSQPYLTFNAELYDYDDSVLETLYKRSIGRAEVEDFDWVILKSMLDDPATFALGRGAGLGHLFVEPYIPNFMLYYMQGRVVFPKTGLTYFLVNGGVVGVFLALILLSKLTPSMHHSPRVIDRDHIIFLQRTQQALIPLVVMLMLRIYVFDIALFIAALFTLGAKRHAWHDQTIGIRIFRDFRIKRLHGSRRQQVNDSAQRGR